MARALWSGTLSFGLVSVPVELFTATESKALRFHFLDRRDMSPISYDKVSKSTGKHVPDDEIIRGFELDDGRFVELTEDDVDRLDVELARTIDICTFVPTAEIDPLYFRKAYYLLPKEGAGKPYRLLLRALEETERAAIARVVIRDKQYLACVRPLRRILLLETMYYSDEVRRPETVPAVRLREPEIAMAKALVEQLSTSWEPERYHDRYRSELLDLLEAKAGSKTASPNAKEPGDQGVDLMEALRQSVEATRHDGKPKRRARTGKV